MRRAEEVPKHKENEVELAREETQHQNQAKGKENEARRAEEEAKHKEN